MAETKSKTPIRRSKKAAISPPPVGPLGGMTSDPTCGHSDCGSTCNVRYVGPTSHIRDHHIMHAAYGASHVWAAAIIAGLAVVITGAVAFNTQAATTGTTPSLNTIYAAIQNLNTRMDRVEESLAKINSQCSVTAQCPGGGQTNPTGGSCEDQCKAAQATATADFNLDACVKNCENPLTPSTTGTGTTVQGNSCLTACSQTTLSCLKAAGDSTAARAKCTDADKSCRNACESPSGAPSPLAPTP